MSYIGETKKDKVTYLEEIVLPNGDIEFKKQVVSLTDPGFDVKDDKRLMSWAGPRSGGADHTDWQVWRNRDRNLAGVLVFRPKRRRVRGVVKI